MADSDAPWGRVDETGTVFVREAEGERAVGQYPDGTPEEALAYFRRKYADLAGQVSLLEQRARGGAPAADVAKAVASLTAALESPNAVGDLAALRGRVAALSGTVAELGEKQSEEARAALEAALAERTAIVEDAEALAAQDPAKVQWKATSARLDELFGRWQRHQTEGPRIPKRDADALWARFRAARQSLDASRRAFYAELDARNKDVRSRKEELIAAAEALAPQGAAGIGAYLDLKNEWSGVGHAAKRVDDALWARFKAAGDVLFSAKAERDARENVELSANLEQKLALLAEAEPLLTATDRAQARSALTGIQRRWDAIGHVPRDQVRTVEDRLRRIEQAVKRLEEEHWQRSDPEKQARSDGLAAQLESAIARLEAERDAAKARGDAKGVAAAEEAIAARRLWLGAIAR
ncbi:MAG: DUF349 domain-containing protein [Microbacteriaceae bacterium]